MKKLILILFPIILSSAGVLAQNIPSSAEKRIDLLTRVMATELQLNEVAFIKLRSLNRERILKADEVAAMYSNEPAIAEAKLNEIEKSFNKKFLALLNPVQIAAYQNYQKGPDEKLTALKTGKPEPKNTPAKTSPVTGRPKR